MCDMTGFRLRDNVARFSEPKASAGGVNHRLSRVRGNDVLCDATGFPRARE